MALVLSGDAGITFPSGSGTQAAQSKVLQVVSYTANATGTIAQTTSQTLSSTGFSVSITPLFSTSKILVTVQSTAYLQGTPTILGIYTIYRGSTNLASGGTSPQCLTGVQMTSGGSVGTPLFMQVLDSPSTTSSTTYTVYFAGTTGQYTQFGTSIGFAGNSSSIITAMEIAA
jgi:hypothetical protein